MNNDRELLAKIRAMQIPEEKRHPFAKMCVCLTFIAIGICVHAYVAMAWWAWFLTPHGLGMITFAQAVVLRFGASMLSMKRQTGQTYHEPIEEMIYRWAMWAIIAPGIAYLTGMAFKAWLLP